MKTLSQAILELQNQWHNILFNDNHTVAITKDGEIVEIREMVDVNVDADVVEFIEAFLSGSL